jgi:transcriptional regulator with XRE-family HTH domain
LLQRTDEGEIFGAQLRKLRLARGMTQGQLAERCRSNVPFISNLERGLTAPSLAMLLRLADGLKCRVYDLVKVFDRGQRILPKSRKD